MQTSQLSYTAGTPAVPITSSLTVTSADDTTLASATVTISTGLVPADDSLSFTSQNGITGSYSPGTGVLTLTGTSSLANYQAALRSVGYADANAAEPAGTRTVSFQVNDGAAGPRSGCLTCAAPPRCSGARDRASATTTSARPAASRR